MKIVQVCGWYFPDSLGGTENYVAALAERLHRAGHETYIAAPDPLSTTERSYEHEGVPVYRYPIPASPTRREARHDVAVRGAERFHAWLARIKPDVVHFHTFVTGVGPHEIAEARAVGARVFVTTHAGNLGFLCQRGTMMRWGRSLCDGLVKPGKCAACALQGRGLPAPLARVLGWIPPLVGGALGVLPGPIGTAVGMSHLITQNKKRQATMLRDVDGFFVLTEWASRALAANGFHDRHVLVNRLGMRPSSVPVAAPRRRRNGEPLTIAYVGRFEPIKGVREFARAIRALGQRHAVRFELRGPISSLRELAIADELKKIVGPDAWVRFGDPIPPADVLGYLRQIDLLCAPSMALEGGPTVALEAMAVGTPVLATTAGAMAELIQDGVSGRLVPPGDWRALAHAMREIVEHPDTTIERWRNALPAVRTMTDVAEDYLHAYGDPVPVGAGRR